MFAGKKIPGISAPEGKSPAMPDIGQVVSEGLRFVGSQAKKLEELAKAIPAMLGMEKKESIEEWGQLSNEEAVKELTKLREEGSISGEAYRILLNKYLDGGSTTDLNGKISLADIRYVVEVIKGLQETNPEAVAEIIDKGLAQGGVKALEDLKNSDQLKDLARTSAISVQRAKAIFDAFVMGDTAALNALEEEQHSHDHNQDHRNDSSAATSGDFANKLGGLTANARRATEEIIQRFGPQGLKYIRDVHGKAHRAGGGEHPLGLASDFMVAPYSEAGKEISEWAMENADRLGIKYIIWGQRIWNPSRDGGPKPWEQWRRMSDRGSVTENHWDHPHISFNH